MHIPQPHPLALSPPRDARGKREYRDVLGGKNDSRRKCTSWRGKDDLDSLSLSREGEDESFLPSKGQLRNSSRVSQVVESLARKLRCIVKSFVYRSKAPFMFRREMMAILRVYMKRCLSEASPAGIVEIYLLRCFRLQRVRRYSNPNNTRE